MRRETYPQGEATHLPLKWNLHHFSTAYCWVSTCYYFPWGVKRPLNGNSFSFAPQGKKKRKKWHVLRDDRAPLLDRFFTSPTQPPNEVLLFPIYRWENRIREVKGQCQSLTAMVWVHPGCITRPVDSEARVHPSCCQCSRPDSAGPLSFQALGHGEMEQDSRTRPALSLDTRQGEILTRLKGDAG